MPYVDPNTVHNPTTGAVIPASWGDNVRDNLEFLIDPPACSVYGSAVQVLTDNTAAAILADSELFDSAAMHSTSSNTSRITIPTGLGGRYMIVATVFFESNGTGARIVRLRVDGSTNTDMLAVGGSAASSTVLSFSKPLVLTAGQYVEIMGLQTSGGDLDVQLTDFSAYFLTR